MKENEEKIINIRDQKAKIRERYKGVDESKLDIIPAHPQLSLYEETKEKRVAVYARVSTDDPRQTSSYELQKNHYQDVVNRHVGWKLYKIYADEGISGTSLQHRDAFIQMIYDCKAGLIDLIVTKSVSRFARNVLDCIGYVRELKAMQPPIGVFFETENIYTLDSNSEMSLSFISTLAQEESHNKSEIMNASIEMRFRRGIFLTPPLLGYDQDEDGNLVINEEEAEVVRLIFYMYLNGKTCAEIADWLTALGCRTKRDNEIWAVGTVQQVLTNERHCGDVLARKTWTPNYLNHKVKKNNQDRNQYLQRDHHDPIISRGDFIAVQRMMANAKYRNKSLLPQLQIISGGILSGFVIVNPRWAGFTTDDYRNAALSVCEKTDQPMSELIKHEAKIGEFDYRGFEVTRGQFFPTKNCCSVTLTMDNIKFSMNCVRQMNNIYYVKLLLHPIYKLICVCPAQKDDREAIKWAKAGDANIVTRKISGAAFLNRIFELMNWNSEYRYKICGRHIEKSDVEFIEFFLEDAEAYIPSEKEGGPKVHVYPAEWQDGFGEQYYKHSIIQKLWENAPNTTGSISTYRSECKVKVSDPKKIEFEINRISHILREKNNG